jgi:hypothetical protein
VIWVIYDNILCGVDKAPTDPMGWGGGPNLQNTKNFYGSFLLDFAVKCFMIKFLLDPSYEIWEHLANNYRASPQLSIRGVAADYTYCVVLYIKDAVSSFRRLVAGLSPQT